MLTHESRHPSPRIIRTFGKESMPARLKILIFVFSVFALTNAGNAALIAFRHTEIAWPAKSALSSGGSIAYLIAIYLIWRKQSSARWIATVFVAIMMAIVVGPFLLRFLAFVAQGRDGDRFSSTMWVNWTHAIVYLIVGIAYPLIVYRLISSEKSRTWLNS